ncbi:MAG TPA: hypothetical protein VIW25_11360 [Nitrososphaeraceae archaeon]
MKGQSLRMHRMVGKIQTGEKKSSWSKILKIIQNIDATAPARTIYIQLLKTILIERSIA